MWGGNKPSLQWIASTVAPLGDRWEWSPCQPCPHLHCSGRRLLADDSCPSSSINAFKRQNSGEPTSEVMRNQNVGSTWNWGEGRSSGQFTRLRCPDASVCLFQNFDRTLSGSECTCWQMFIGIFTEAPQVVWTGIYRTRILGPNAARCV